MALLKYIQRTSMKSASPAAAMPIRNRTSRETKKTLFTRPRISRGVFRWTIRRDRSKKGVEETFDCHNCNGQRNGMGERIENAGHGHDNKTGRDPGAFPHPVEDTGQQQAGHYKTKRVRPSCRPYSNSVAFSARRAKGSSKAFDIPKAIRVGIDDVYMDRRMGVSKSWCTPTFRFFTTIEILVSLPPGEV